MSSGDMERLALGALVLASCSLRRPADVSVDAQPAPRVVTGTMHDLWPGATATLSLTTPSGTETLFVSSVGGFAFSSPMRGGEAYEVKVEAAPDGHTCTVEGGTGNFTFDTPTNVIVDCSAAEVSLSLADSFTLVPDVTTYAIPTSLLTQRVGVTVTAPAATTITVAGATATNGVPTPVALPMGLTHVPVSITIGGGVRTYSIDFVRGARPIRQVAYLKPLAARPEGFGSALSSDGPMVAVGAPLDNSGASGVGGDPVDSSVGEAGSVTVYRRQAGSWSVDAYTKSDKATAGEHFGASVSLQGDVLAVGAPGGAGSVYIFERGSGQWKQTAHLTAPNAEPGDAFGSAVMLHGDSLVVGAPGEDSGLHGAMDDNSASDAGAAYAYRRLGDGSWTFEAYLKRSLPKAHDWFGGGDQNWCAPLASNDQFFLVAGGNEWSAFVRSGYLWSLPIDTNRLGGWLTASGSMVVGLNGAGIDIMVASPPANPTGFALEHSIGVPFGLFDNLAPQAMGDLLALGEPHDCGAGRGIDPPPSGTACESGSVVLYSPIATESEQRSYIKASNAEANDYFGRIIALSSDTLAVTAWWETGTATGVNGDQSLNSNQQIGAVYVFQ